MWLRNDSINGLKLLLCFAFDTGKEKDGSTGEHARVREKKCLSTKQSKKDSGKVNESQS